MRRASRHTWTEADTRSLRRLAADGLTPPQIAARMGLRDKLIRERCQRHGIKPRRAILGKFKWTPAKEAILSARYESEPATAIAADIGCTLSALYQRAYKLGLKKSSEFARECTRKRWAQGRHAASLAGLEKGRGWNKGMPASQWNPNAANCKATQFKPAEMPYNWVPVGSLRVTHDGQLERKVMDNQEPGMSRRNWVSVARLVWEAANGAVPQGYIVRFREGLHTTKEHEITADRLECISRRENMLRNSRHTRYPPELNQLIQLKGALNRKINNRTKGVTK